MKLNNVHTTQGVVIYQAKNGAIELRGDTIHETVWATQAQIAVAFEVNVRTINEHIQNIIKTRELLENATIRNYRIVQQEGGREVVREIKHYNLDMILSIGYRINSKKATLFRQWATKTLRSYIIDGFVVNKKIIAKNYAKFQDVVGEIKNLLPVGSVVSPHDAAELVLIFADTWLSLDAYDRDILTKGKLTKKSVELTADIINHNIAELKINLIHKLEATDIFAIEIKQGTVEGIVGNVMQSFNGRELYESVEEKAANLLYFMVKDHPFIDGNKRSGAFAFVWFLKQTDTLNVQKITPSALTALTILVAESKPIQKDKIIKLILNLISNKG